MTEIRCSHNHLTKLDVTGNPSLQSLRCFNNHITELDLTRNVLLTELYCSENKISKLDTHRNPKLERLNHSNNLILEPDHPVKGVGTLSFYGARLQWKETELSVSTEASAKADMNRLTPVIRNAWANFRELNDRALDLIAGMHPDEDVNELVLSELAFDKDGMFRLGYDAGDTPAGQLCIYVLFNDKLEMNGDLVYETY